MSSKSRHDGFFFFRFHFAVDTCNAQVGEGAGLQRLRVFGHSFSFIRCIFIFGYQRAYDIGLPSFGYQLPYEIVKPWVIAAGDGKGIYRLPSRREFVDDGNIQITVENQCQRPGNGCGRHDQHMWGMPLGAES